MFVALANCCSKDDAYSSPVPFYIAAGLDATAALALIIIGVLGMKLGFLANPAAHYAMIGAGAGYGLCLTLISITSKKAGDLFMSFSFWLHSARRVQFDQNASLETVRD